jgi:predicted hydrolase (HD superfamily)
MISLEEARRLASLTSRLVHSFTVSSLMGRLAELLDADTELWMLVGVLHDLDYDDTVDDRSRHGLLTADRLIGLLPEEGLKAILCHDHRTGLKPETDIDYALILCDSIAIVIEAGRIEFPVDEPLFSDCLEMVSGEKPWIRELIAENPILAKIELQDLLEPQ